MARNPAAVAKALVRAQRPSPAGTQPTGNGFGGSPATVQAGMSPLVASYGEWTSGRNHSRGLPRPWELFSSGTFGPLVPMQPTPVDTPQQGEDRAAPRRWQYPVSWNIPHGQPGDEGLKLASFTQLRTIADTYSVARACVRLRKDEILGLGWDIVPTKSAEKAMRGDRQARRDFEERRGKLLKFFSRPDSDYFSFRDWFSVLLEDVLVVDAMSLYLWPARTPGKGVLGSDLGELAILDGTTIRPLVDVHGGRPRSPAPAYQQYLFGVPRSDLMSVLADEDITDLGADPEQEYRGDQLIYRCYSPRDWTPYGFAPIEQALVPILAGMQRQQYQLDFFAEGTIPGLFVINGDPNSTPNQNRELQDALNAMAGDPAWKHKIIVLPQNSKTELQRPAELAGTFDEIIMTQVCTIPDMEVVTRNGLVPIKDIGVGDEVLTHRGRWRPVTRVMRNPVHEPVRRICANGLDPLEVTGNHPVWTAQYGQTRTHRAFYERTEWVAARDIRAKETSGPFGALTLPIIAPGSSDASLRLASHIRGRGWWVREQDDFLTHSNPNVKPLPAEVPMGAALGRLLGLYLAEGSCTNGQVTWYFHENEVAYQQQVIDDLAAVFGLSAKVRPVAGEKCARVVCNSALLAELFSCGTARTKSLPPWAWDGSPEFYSSLLWGWIAGDGTLTPKGWRGYTTSRNLAWQMRLVALTCGHEPQFRTQTQNTSTINGRLLNGAGEPVYVVEAILDQKRRGTYRIDGPHLTSAVRSNTASAYAGDVVYNLEVDEDHSYVTTGGTVHNCMAFSVMPMELGITPRSSTSGHSGGAANQMGKMSQDIQERKANRPMLEWVGDVFNHVIRSVCGQHDMQWWWEGLEEDEDEQTKTDIQAKKVAIGLMSVDEARVENGAQPWGLPMTSDPVLVTPTGVIPFGSIDPGTGQPIGLTPKLTATPAPPGVFGQPPQGDDGQGGQPANSTPPKPTSGPTSGMPAPTGGGTPAHTSAQANTAEGGKPTAPAPTKPVGTATAKAAAPIQVHAALRELDLIRRRLVKARSLDGWAPEALPAAVFAKVAEAGTLAAVDEARAVVKAAGHRQWREQATASARARIVDGLHRLAGRLAVGGSPLTFVDSAVVVLRGGIRQGLEAGVNHTPATKAVSQEFADWQAAFDARFDLYAHTANVAYDQGTALATLTRPGNWVIRWDAQPDACVLCDARSGNTYTPGDLPGLPGMGGFGSVATVCLGGPNCRCGITWIRDDDGTGTTTSPVLPDNPVAQGATTTFGRQLAVDVAAMQAAGGDPRAVSELLDLVADRMAAEQRPYLEGLLQDLLADLGQVTTPPPTTPALSTRPPDGGHGGVVPAAVVAAGTAAAIATQVGSQQQTQPAAGQPAAVKSAKPLTGPPVPAGTVVDHMRRNYPDSALGWVAHAHWVGPVGVPTDRVDTDDRRDWAANHQPQRVEHFTRRLESGKPARPGVSVLEPGESKVKVIDGHHRYLASVAAGEPFRTYIGEVNSNGGPWGETHTHQTHQGVDASNKTANPVAAGLAVRASDTGRVLMLQRAMTDGDPAGGYWEFPGGKLDPGEAAVDAAVREWQEEVGLRCPDGSVRDGWSSPDGVYRGFVLTVPSEDDVPIHDGRDQVTNPDDPDRDEIEARAWWDPEQMRDNPAIRPELAADMDTMLAALDRTSRAKKCLVCGCGHPTDSHGDPGLPVLDDVELRMPDGDTLAYLHSLFDEKGRERFGQAIAKARDGAVGRYRARHLIRWYNEGADGQIPWGADGDWAACVAVAGRHMAPEQAKGFCNLRHHDSLGVYPATHAALEHGKK